MQRTAHIYGEHEVSKLDDVTKLLTEEGYVGRPKESTEETVQRVPRDDTGRDEDERDGEELEETEATSEEAKEETRYSVKDLAAKLELTPKQLYAAMDVKLSDGSTMTLSELKDLAVKGKSIDSHTERRDKDYNELMVQRREVETIAQKLANEGKLSEATIQEVKEQYNQRMASEMKLLLKALPDWENQSIRTKEVKQVAEYARQYGISSQELDALVTDHRLMKLIRDVATKPVKQSKEPAPIGRVPKTMQAKVDTTTTAGKVQAISALLN